MLPLIIMPLYDVEIVQFEESEAELPYVIHVTVANNQTLEFRYDSDEKRKDAIARLEEITV